MSGNDIGGVDWMVEPWPWRPRRRTVAVFVVAGLALVGLAVWLKP